jgi:hypothetical protein
MRPLAAILAVVVAVGLAPPALAQNKGMSDPNCPTAIPALKAIAAIPNPNDAEKVSAAALVAVRAYQDCASTMLAAGKIEPEAHYAQTRVAQYQVLYGRALMKLGKFDEAHDVFWEASKLSSLVADWTAPGYGYTNSNKNPEKAAAISGEPVNAQHTEHNPGVNRSQWRDAATEVRRAADMELVKFVPVPSSTSR